MWDLPTSVEINGRTFHIRNKGDYRMILDCFNALNDEELSEDYRVLACLLIFYNEFKDVQSGLSDEDTIALVKYMYKFFNCGQEENQVGATTNRPLIDWNKDSQMICAAVNNVAKIEVRSLEYLHWWTFMGYYLSVGESVLSTVVSLRSKIIKHQKLDKWEQDFKKENPEYFIWKSTTAQEREVEDIVRNLWNQGGE